MKRTYSLMLVGVMALAPLARATDRVVTTETGTGAGSLTAAINALLDGDRITFNIPPNAGEVHYVQVPANGFPLITKNDITIDGYTQNGASPNTASIHAANNAALKIVITATNGNALSMYWACTNSWGANIPNFGYGDDEQAILGFFHATNANLKGVVIQSAPTTATSITAGTCKGICFAANSLENGGGQCQNWHINGCWFAIDPVTKQVAYMPDGSTVATPSICAASYRTRNVVGGTEIDWNYNQPGTIGVAARSAAPRAEFNVFVTGYGYDSEGKNYRVSGNFYNILPDGVTPADMSSINGGVQMGDGYFEVGRNASGVVFGTDGDGINDADEGNICCGFGGGNGSAVYTYSLQNAAKNMVIAGNYFNADINGNPIVTWSFGKVLHQAVNTGTYRFGSDFNGVSDALEGNLSFNQLMFDFDNGSWPTNGAWLSMRGNSLSNCWAQVNAGPQTSPPFGNGQSGAESGANTYAQFIDTTGAGGTLDFIPVIIAGTTANSLSGTCGKPISAAWVNPYTNLVVDIYEADTTIPTAPQGKKWIASFTDNSAADSNPAVGAFTFNTTGLGLAGKQIVIAVSYLRYTQATIASVARSGSQSTVTLNNIDLGNYGILKSAALSPASFSPAAIALGGTATFTDSNNPISVYRAQTPTASGQTSPFSAAFTIP